MYKHKKLLILSISLNIFFLIFIVGFVAHKGGISYLKDRIVGHSSIEKDPYYLNRSQQLATLKNNSNPIIMLGDSITDQGEWQELFPGVNIINRGIGGDTTDRILMRINSITSLHPRKVFILVGINDLQTTNDLSNILSNYQKIIDSIHTESPETEIFIQSLLPVNNTFRNVKLKEDSIPDYNKRLVQLATESNATYVDLYSVFANDNKLDVNYSADGLHLNGNGYLLYKNTISKYIKTGN